MTGRPSPMENLHWWVMVYAFAATPIDFGTIGLTSGSGPDVIRWALLFPVWFLPVVLIGPRWAGLGQALRRPPVSWFLAWAALGLVSVAWGTVPKQAMLIGLAMAGQSLLAVWYVYTAGWYRLTTAATTGLTAVVGAGVLFDVVNGTLINGVVEGRAIGLTTGPTTQGRLAAFVIVLAAGIVAANRNIGRWPVLPMGAAGVALVALVFAETRTSMIAVVLGLFYGGLRRFAPLNRWLISGGLVVLALAALGMSTALVDVAAFGERNDPTSVSGRTEIWPVVIDLVVERPVLGYGWGAEEQIFVEAARNGLIDFQAGTSHSMLLSPLLSGGVIGFCLLVTALGSAARLRRQVDPWIVGAALAVLFHGLTEALIHRPSVSLLLLASAMAAVSLVPRWGAPTGSPPTAAYLRGAGTGLAGDELESLHR